MAVISLPLTFNNSFWTQDYRRGLEVLYTKLEQVRTPRYPPRRNIHSAENRVGRRRE
jgi:hypothetical protein